VILLVTINFDTGRRQRDVLILIGKYSIWCRSKKKKNFFFFFFFFLKKKRKKKKKGGGGFYKCSIKTKRGIDAFGSRIQEILNIGRVGTTAINLGNNMRGISTITGTQFLFGSETGDAHLPKYCNRRNV